MHTMTYGWIGQGSFNLSRSKSRNKFFALSAWIALIYAAWCSISWYILRHFECESQSSTGSQNKRYLPCKALGGFFIGWKVWGLVIRGLPFSDGKLAYILRWYNLCGLLCSIGRNKKSMPCWKQKQCLLNKTKHGQRGCVSGFRSSRMAVEGVYFVCPVGPGSRQSRNGLDVLEVGFLWRLGAICLGGRARKSLLYRLKRGLCQRKTVENACQMTVAKKTILC